MPKFEDYDRLLARQLRRHGIEEIPDSWKGFIAEVNEVYKNADKDRNMLERALELTSDEMLEIYEKLKDDAEKRLSAETELHAAREKMLSVQKHEELGRLAQNVAHDFNNLLAIIGGHAQSLDDLPLPEVQNIAREIWLVVERGRDIAKQILTFSKKEKLDLRPVEIKNLLQKYKNLLQSSLGNTHALDLNLPAEDFYVNVDEGQFSQILLNLTVNARDAMKEAGRFSISGRGCALSDEVLGEIQPNAANRLGLEAIRRHGLLGRQFVHLKFSDTGTGIPEIFLGKIFQPYFTTKSFARGTGLGLAVVYSAIKQLQGYVFCSSVVNGGTTFHLFLPVAPAPENPKAADSPERPAAIPGKERRSECILVVEDEPAIRDSIATMLRREQFTVETADRGDTAMRCIQGNRKLSLIICDHQLSGMDGCEVVKNAKQVLPDIKVLMITGAAYSGGPCGIDGSAFPVLAKPFSMRSLTEKGNELLA